MRLSVPSLLAALVGVFVGQLFHFIAGRQVRNAQLRTAEAQARAAEAQLRLLREQREAGGHERQGSSLYDDRLSHNLEVILTRTEAELAAIDDDVDAADNRVYAFLALNAVLIFGLVSLRDTLQPWWWTPVIGLLISSACFCWALLPRDYYYGPNIEEFYLEWQYASPNDVKAQLIGELYGAIGKNRLLLRRKSRPFYLGFGLLLLTIVAGGVGVGVTTAMHVH